MMIPHRHLRRAPLLPLLLALAGCSYMQSPSILTTAPPPPVKQTKREPQGGFAILVDAPGQPSVARAVADIGAFAQRRGFARQGEGRYFNGRVALDVTYRQEDSRVLAILHGNALSHGFTEDFYRGFNREYAPKYGEENPIIESDFTADRPLGL